MGPFRGAEGTCNCPPSSIPFYTLTPFPSPSPPSSHGHPRHLAELVDVGNTNAKAFFTDTLAFSSPTGSPCSEQVVRKRAFGLHIPPGSPQQREHVVSKQTGRFGSECFAPRPRCWNSTRASLSSTAAPNGQIGPRCDASSRPTVHRALMRWEKVSAEGIERSRVHASKGTIGRKCTKNSKLDVGDT